MQFLVSPQVLPILLLIGSNIFMTAAWYWHLRFTSFPIAGVIAISWGLALIEYCLAVPANRYGFRAYSAAELKTIHFDFDRAVLRSEAVDALHVGADWLRRNPGLLVLIEGHCDERGTNEYNLALGEQRARAAMDFLVAQGVGVDRITVLSHGKEQPVCRDQNEPCWRQNRRAEFKVRER